MYIFGRFETEAEAEIGIQKVLNIVVRILLLLKKTFKALLVSLFLLVREELQ